MVSKADSNQLINQLLLPTLPPGLADSGDIKYMAESILITPHAADRSILGQVGGIGKKLTWKVSRSAVYENNIWAVRLAPRPVREKYYTPANILWLS